jgi:type IV secretion system protein VirB10
LFSGKSNKKSDVKSQEKTVVVNQGYEAELAENLDQLKSMNKHSLQSPHSFPVLSDNAGSSEQSKEYTARQNAPSNIYTGGVQNTSNAASSENSKAGNTFTGKGLYSSFGNQATAATAVSAQRIAHPRYTIASGEFIHATLETAIDSTLPGQLRAVISEPVYAYVGEKPLVPAGSRLIGQYSSSVLQGQNRVFVVWNRIILPSGITIQLNSPGVDGIGRAGMGADSVNTHFFSRFGEATLLSILGAVAANSGVSNSDQYNSASQYRMGIAQSLQQSASGSLKGSASTKPTLHIYQGASINVFVAHDLDFYSVRSSFNNVSPGISSVYRGDHG